MDHRSVRTYFCAVRPSAFRSTCAAWLLVLAVFTVLPRTLFHACERMLDHAEAEAGSVHADAHCAICEAPAPIHEGAVTLSFAMDEVELGAGAPPCAVLLPVVTREAPRLRGPPARV